MPLSALARAGHRDRQGFTLIELLVVIAIIAILIALMVPAVQKVREVAARTQCCNNQKQIAIGMHAYHDVLKRFPNSYHLNLGHVNGDWGWGTSILPYIEQAGLQEVLNPGDYTGDIPPVNTTTQTFLAVFLCPADPTGNLNTNAKNYAKNNYAPSEQIMVPNQIGVSTTNYVRISDVTDGTSYTFLVGERDMLHNLAAVWIGRIQGVTDAMTYGRADLPLNTPFAGGGDPNCTRHAWTSLHPGGANFAFCDGSVVFVSDTIESATGFTQSCPGVVNTANFTYQNLYRRNDGNSIVHFP
jgi:prepilin-type N-terminal cleavage/methylation domain-containing protein/prepilin-type processing-associated H-X9-DG protein